MDWPLFSRSTCRNVGYIIDIIIWRLKLKRHQYLGADAAHFKAFSLRYLKTESCSECLRVPFKTNPAPVNHSAFQPIPKLPFLKAAFPAVLLYCTMACFEAFLLPRLLPQIKRAKWTAWDSHQLRRNWVWSLLMRSSRPRIEHADDRPVGYLQEGGGGWGGWKQDF